MTTGPAADGGEGRRQAYLAALGLPLWTSRVVLPGALPSDGLVAQAWWSADVPADLPLAPVDAVSATPGAPVVTSAVDRAPAMPPSVAAAPSPVFPVPAPVADLPAAGTAPLRFALRVQALAPGWFGVVSLGDLPDLSAQEHQLLAALGHALGAAPDFSAPASQLRWPLNRNPRLDHGADAAREWLAHALRVPAGMRVVVLGEAAVLLRAALPSSVGMVAGPSLATLLASPQLKKALWQALHA